MPTVTLTAKYVNPAAEGKKYGSIVDEDGNRYPATPHHVSKVRQGQTVTIDYDEQTWGGKPVMVVSKIHENANNPPPPSPDDYGVAPVRSNGYAGGNGHAKEADIFVTGVVGRAMGSGQFTVTDIKSLTLAADEAWQALQAKRAGNSPLQ